MNRPATLIPILLLLSGGLAGEGLSQSTFSVPRRTQDVLVDGFLHEWSHVPVLEMHPELTGLGVEGEFKEDDVRLQLQAQWDDQYLYLALTWHDDSWDIQEVTRRDAVWVDASGKRRDRMLLFDFLKFHIRQSNYDYTLWVSPRHQDQGPFFWHRLLEGYRGMERAAGSPMVTAREHEDGRVTMELMFLWRELRLKPRQGFPLTLILADSDLPGRLPEYKAGFMKSLTWRGQWSFAQ